MSDKEFLLVKALEVNPSTRFFAENLQANMQGHNNPNYYAVTYDADRALRDELDEDETYRVYFVQYAKEEGRRRVTAIYAGECWKGEARPDPQPALLYNLYAVLEDPEDIEHLSDYLELDIEDDFVFDSYITLEQSAILARRLDFILRAPHTPQRAQDIELDDEKQPLLSDFAQHNQHCKKSYYNPTPDHVRSEYQRDYERILHSKAYRRLVDKAQVFSAEKGDHYRTRMTHTQVVSQIARAMAMELGLNSFLTEAIALGHDVGHTPFGHQGERTLQSILSGEIPLIEKVSCEILHQRKRVAKPEEAESIEELLHAFDPGYGSLGGFKHNYQSLRVLTKLEEVYFEIEGLDLTFQTLDGIWKHTWRDEEKFQLAEFVRDESLRKYLNLHGHPLTLEGQVVAVADEIAQRSHDLEDALSAGLLTVEELIAYLGLSKVERLGTLRQEIERLVAQRNGVEAQNRHFVDREAVLHGRIAARIIEYFIQDTCSQSAESIQKYADEHIAECGEYGVVLSERLVSLSQGGKWLCEYLEKIVTSRVIVSPEVAQFDSNGAAVVATLFKAYYANPALLHEGTKRRILYDFRVVAEHVVDLEFGSVKAIRNEWDKVLTSMEGDYPKKRKVLIRNIADFISGMTDSYALKEYHKIHMLP